MAPFQKLSTFGTVQLGTVDAPFQEKRMLLVKRSSSLLLFGCILSLSERIKSITRDESSVETSDTTNDLNGKNQKVRNTSSCLVEGPCFFVHKKLFYLGSVHYNKKIVT